MRGTFQERLLLCYRDSRPFRRFCRLNVLYTELVHKPDKSELNSYDGISKCEGEEATCRDKFWLVQRAPGIRGHEGRAARS